MEHVLLTVYFCIEVPRNHRTGKTLETRKHRNQQRQETAYCIVARSCNGRAKGTEGREHGGGGRERKNDSWKFEARITYASSRFAEFPDVSRSFHVIRSSVVFSVSFFISRVQSLRGCTWCSNGCNPMSKLCLWKEICWAVANITVNLASDVYPTGPIFPVFQCPIVPPEIRLVASTATFERQLMWITWMYILRRAHPPSGLL